MPELPEVETVRRQLRRYILQKPIKKVRAEVSKIIGNEEAFIRQLPGVSFTDIQRTGKLLIFRTNKPNTNVLCHLKMTGQLIFVDQEPKAGGGHSLTSVDLELPHKHTHIDIIFKDGSHLYFSDMRKFGYMKLASDDEVLREQKKFGIEPIAPDFRYEDVASLFAKRTTTVKALLLNQKLVAGLGNIYVDEVCFKSGVRPDRIASTLTSDEIKKIFKFSREVLQHAVEVGGTTFYSFRRADGKKGGYQNYLQVFQRDGQPCHTCGTTIIKTKVTGRGTHICPKCQN